MKNIRFIFFVVLLLAVAVPLFVRIGTRTPSTPVIEVSKSELSFGPVHMNNSHEHSLTLRNTTSKEVVLSQFLTSCGCTKISPKKMTLLPGEAKTITLTVNLWDLVQLAKDPLLEGSVSVTPVAKGFRIPPLKIRAWAHRPMVVVRGGSVDFGTVAREQVEQSLQTILVSEELGNVKAAPKTDGIGSVKLVESVHAFEQGYRQYRLQAAFSEKDLNLHKFEEFSELVELSSNDSDWTTVVMCKGTIDSGLRMVFENGAKSLVQIGEPVDLNILVYSVYSDLQELKVRSGGHAEQEVEQEEGIFKLSLKWYPARLGDNHLDVQVLGRLKDSRVAELGFRHSAYVIENSD